QHHPVFDRRGSRQRTFERWIQFGQGDFGEEAEAAEIDAEEGDVRSGGADAVGHREERAIAAEHDDHVDALDDPVLFRDRVGRRLSRSCRMEAMFRDGAKTRSIISTKSVASITPSARATARHSSKTRCLRGPSPGLAMPPTSPPIIAVIGLMTQLMTSLRQMS